MEDKSFKVVDKRIFGTEEGSKSTEGGEPKAEDKRKSTTSPPLPPVDFSNLILSLSTSAIINLGEVPNPITNKEDKNLEMARHTIDTIALLKEKTKGNLTEGEEKLIDAVLFDLRMRYVNITSK